MAKILDRALIVLLVASAVCLLLALIPGLVSMKTLRGIVAPRATWDPDATYDGNYLHGGSFRESYVDAGDSGSIEQGWSDQSQDGRRVVRYSSDFLGGHGAGPSQRIDIPAGTQWQLAQYRVLPWGSYRAEFWMRSNDKIPVIVAVRGGSNWQPYLIDKVLVRNGWKRYEISGFVNSWGPCAITLESSRPGTLWLQDARLRMTGGGFTGVISIALGCLLLLGLAVWGVRHWFVSGTAAEFWAWVKSPLRPVSLSTGRRREDRSGRSI